MTASAAMRPPIEWPRIYVGTGKEDSGAGAAVAEEVAVAVAGVVGAAVADAGARREETEEVRVERGWPWRTLGSSPSP